MLTIEGTRITVTRGDTLTLTVGMKKNNQTYVMQEGDAVRFAISIGHKGDAGYKLITTADIPSDTLTFTLPSTETEKLTRSLYCYDIEMTYADGTVDTFISDYIEVRGESE